MDISQVSGGAAEPQGQMVQGGGQLPSVRDVGQDRASCKPGHRAKYSGLMGVFCDRTFDVLARIRTPKGNEVGLLGVLGKARAALQTPL